MSTSNYFRTNSFIFHIIAFFAFLYFLTPGNVLLIITQLNSDKSSFLFNIAKIIFFISTLLISTYAIFLLYFSKYKSLRILFWILTLFFVSDLIYIAITSTHINVTEIIFALREYRLIADTFSFYASYIIIGAAVYAFMLFISEKFIIKRFKINLPAWLTLIVTITALSMIYCSLLYSHGRRDAYPAQLRIPVLIPYILVKSYEPHVGLWLKTGPRERVAAPAKATKADIVLYIVDESVSANALECNGARYNNTPRLNKMFGKTMQNLGIASSVYNASAPSNFILRNNIQADQLPDPEQKSFTAPSLFTYAKSAGYTTYLIDAQSTTSLLQNFLTKYDMEDIDHYIYMPDTDNRYMNDFEAINIIHGILKKGEKCFIYLVKQGLHFPFHARYPDSNRPFTPDLRSDNGEEAGSSKKEKLMNTYLNAIVWNVDIFFEDLTQKLEPYMEQTALIYTSDHGQNIQMGSNKRTHATWINPAIIEFSVPLMLYGRLFMQPDMSFQRDCYSQFQIGPTILDIFGYSGENSLFDGCADKRIGFSGNIFSTGSQTVDFDMDLLERESIWRE